MSEVTQAFIERWKKSGGSERANFQRFAIELTQLLGVEEPKLATSDDQNDDYRFERPVDFGPTSTRSRGFMDLYRKDCFVLEAKQGTQGKGKSAPDQLTLLGSDAPRQTRQGHGVRGTARWDDTMLKARNQADRYARAIAREDGWPPFLLIVDVGHVIEVYADFSGQGQGYSQYPDGNNYRIPLDGLADEQVRERLKGIWEHPKTLDPSLQSAKVTREIADHLAKLGMSLEGQGHDSETVARFLMRCLFSMFAEDVELIPKDSFTDLLINLRGHPEHAAPSLSGLWETMNKGGFSQVLMQDLKRFNGGLFADATALPLDNVQLSLLIEAAKADWKQVEPAIFGTLLERALDKRQRHKLGAHYTPRAYVERLVTPTIMEPLREDWKDVQTAVQRLTQDGKDDDARKLVHAFHSKLCEIRVLDPACGSGNFLYVALEMMKRLEGEVTSLLEDLGETQASFITVDPHQFLGIELNPWAANVAELVLWIGYLQWHFRTHGLAAPSEPVLRDFKNIRNGDAVLEWSGRTPRMDANGAPVTRWDGVTTIRHNVTGEEVPDPAARIAVYDYAKPKPTKWPEAEFIVGNPPFIGASRLRESLGDGYVEALWKAYPKMPQSADLVMFWWEKAALAARGWNAKTGKGTRRFGLITTNSLRQTFNRRVLEPHLNDPKKPLSLLFAIPDHPWVDSAKGDASVRIGMTVATVGNRSGRLLNIATENNEKSEADGRAVTFDHSIGKIFGNLRIGADVHSTKKLASNTLLSSQGVKLHGKGFLVTEAQAKSFGYGTDPKMGTLIRPFSNGMDVARVSRNLLTIDVCERNINDVKFDFPEVYQWLLDNVKPQRDENTREHRRKFWWLYGDTFEDLRRAIDSLPRHMVTIRTSRYRYFVFKEFPHLPESGLVGIGLDGAEQLSV